ncbi:MAG: GYD domain-containing protein [Actinomycetota bacterium]|nr:GYD domain-containing protein [Actinomycetota bacterium]
MPTYVNLLRFTDQGVRNYQDTVDRAEAYWGSIEKAGGRLLHQVWTMGDYDIVMLFEAPDDETATSLALGVSSLGNVRTTTMRAFAAEEMRGILERGG